MVLQKGGTAEATGGTMKGCVVMMMKGFSVLKLMFLLFPEKKVKTFCTICFSR